MADTDNMARLFAQHQPDDYGGDSIQCQGCHPRQWFAGWNQFAAHLASLSDERFAQVTGDREDVTRALAEKVALVRAELHSPVGQHRLANVASELADAADVLASLSDERLAQAETTLRAVEAILSDVTDESAADGYVALADARGNRLGQVRAALSGDAAPRTDGDTR